MKQPISLVNLPIALIGAVRFPLFLWLTIREMMNSSFSDCAKRLAHIQEKNDSAERILNPRTFFSAQSCSF